MFSVAELDTFAKIVVAVLGMVSVLAPFTNRLSKLNALQFGYGGLYNFTAEMGSLGGFLVILHERMYLHFFPPFWVWLAAGILSCFVLLGLVAGTQRNSKVWVVIAGAVFYTAAATTIMMAVTQFASQTLIFRSVRGVVTDPSGTPIVDLPVFLTTSTQGKSFQSKTNGSGYFSLLLTEGETKEIDKLFVGVEQVKGDNYETLGASGAGFPLTRNFVYVP